MDRVVLIAGGTTQENSFLREALSSRGVFLSDGDYPKGVNCVRLLPLYEAEGEMLSLRESESMKPRLVLLSGQEDSPFDKEAFIRLRAYVGMHVDLETLGKASYAKLICDYVAAMFEGRRYLRFSSFGYKYGIPSDADLIFDCRDLPNPYWVGELRFHSGLEAPVRGFLSAHEEVGHAIGRIEAYLRDFLKDDKARDYLHIALGCTGGQHRSVYVASELAKAFPGSALTHREEANWRLL